MISVTQDPANADKVIVTATVTLFLDKMTMKVCGEEIEAAIRAQAHKDLRTSPEVKKLIADAATNKLLRMLEEPKPSL